MTVTTLASGSSGNCALVSSGSTHLLVDAGISCRRIKTALAALGLTPDELTGVLITHEHSDHISGLTTLFKHYHLPVWCSGGTGRQLCYRIAFLEEVLHPVSPGDRFDPGGLEVCAVPILHDAADPVGYTFTDGVHKVAFVTDLGVVTSVVEQAVRGSDLLVCEANHDEDWVRSGPYPYHLKQRILGEHGHLSNEAGAELAARAIQSGTKTVLLAHLSQQNNTPIHAYEVACRRLRAMGCDPERDITLAVAPRDSLGPTYCLEGASVC